MSTRGDRDSRSDLGSLGENFVASWLESHGATVISRNFRTRLGEIDIIAAKGNVLAFIEVKTRTRELFDTSHVITRTKQQKIIRTAKLFLAKNRIEDKHCRFDVAIVITTPKTTVRYIRNAFAGF